MDKRLRIAIVGYGTGGQASALLLSADGHEVEVFERAPEPGPVGAGFLLQPVGLSVLWEMGLLERVLAHGAPIRRLYGETSGGRPVMDMRYRELDTRFSSLRDALFHPLSRVPGGRGQMLRVLSGIRRGWLGTFGLPNGFLQALSGFEPAPACPTGKAAESAA